jgi:hypothetical protein
VPSSSFTSFGHASQIMCLYAGSMSSLWSV